MNKIRKGILVIGCLLIVSGVSLLTLFCVRINSANRRNDEIVHIINTILPERRDGNQEPGRDTNMPVLEIQEESLIALLEIPSYGLALPVGEKWNKSKITSYPCRFRGTAYDGSLVIGGSDQSGMFDFFDRIYEGTAVKVTDMTGTQFSYVVDRIDRSKSAEAEILVDYNADLTLFVRDAQLLEYIILRCLEK